LVREVRTINGKKDFSINYYLEGKDQERRYEVVLNLTYMTETESHQLIPYLTSEERDYLKFIRSDKRLRSYLYGRYSLKKAVSQYSNEVQLNNINIKNGIFGQPVIELKSPKNPGGSLSHCETCAASLVYDEALIMGIDIEEVNRNVRKVLENNITTHEASLIKNQVIQETLAFVILWTAKESLAKCLKTGLTVPLELYEVEKIENKEKYFKISFTHFMQYTAFTFVFDTYVCSITYPKLIELSLDITNI
jgi:4'-phosphopantetheinyl transferase